MSRYPTKTEITEIVKLYLVEQAEKIGFLDGLQVFNVAGVMRDLNIIGDSYYGYTFANPSQDAFIKAARDNLRPRYKSMLAEPAGKGK